MTLSAQDFLFTTDDDIRGLISALGLDVRLDDDDSGTVEDAESAFLLQARNYATTRVKFYCAIHYDAADLATSWLVNEWATVLAVDWICRRRANPAPECFKELLFGDGSANNSGVMGDMKDVRAKAAQIPDIGYRNVDWPAWSNITVDPRYRVRQIRVQRPISERTPTQYPQTVDYSSEYNPEI